MRIFYGILLGATVLSASAGSASAASTAPSFCNVPAGYYRVVDEQGISEIGLRADHTMNSELLGTLHRGDIVFSDGTRDTGDNRTWQRIKPWTTTGWIQSRNLHRALPLTLAKTDLPIVGWCGAFAPLWSLRWDEHMLHLSLYPGKHDLPVKSVQSGVNRGTALLSAATADFSTTLVYSDEACAGEDGVVQGWGKAHVIVRRNGTEQLFTGCCKADEAAFVKR